MTGVRYKRTHKLLWIHDPAISTVKNMTTVLLTFHRYDMETVLQ